MKKEKSLKEQIIDAGYVAVEQLVKVAKEDILGGKKSSDDSEDGHLAADRLKNAAATKKLAIFDAFEILSRIETEKENINPESSGGKQVEKKQGFAEGKSKSSRD